MCDWEYKYCTYKGLEFIIHHNPDGLMFDVDYKGELLLIDTIDEMEVVTWTNIMRQWEYLNIVYHSMKGWVC